MSSSGNCQCGSANDATCKGKDSTLMPQVSFSTFILSLYSSALVQLGEVPEPSTGSVEENLEVARHTIDIISMLHEKTVNNVDADEMRLIDGLLYELRMKYIVKTKA